MVTMVVYVAWERQEGILGQAMVVEVGEVESAESVESVESVASVAQTEYGEDVEQRVLQTGRKFSLVLVEVEVEVLIWDLKRDPNQTRLSHFVAEGHGSGHQLEVEEDLCQLISQEVLLVEVFLQSNVCRGNKDE